MKYVQVIMILLILLTERSLTQSVEPSAGDKIPTVAYCKLVRHPSRYDQKLVRTKAYFAAGFEVSGLEDPNCDERRSTFVTFDRSFRVKTKKDVLETFDHIFNPPHTQGSVTEVAEGIDRAEIVIIGEFQSPPRPVDIGGGEFKIGWRGGDKYQFIVQYMEAVKPAPWKKP